MMMDDNDSIITDFSVLNTPRPIRDLPNSAESSLRADDYTSSSSDAVIKALETLQSKIKNLELERLRAEKKFGDFEQEANNYKNLVQAEDRRCENRMPLYRLEPTKTSTPSDKEPSNRPHSRSSRPKSRSSDVTKRRDDVMRTSSGESGGASPNREELVGGRTARALYCPSGSNQPYATYVRPPKEIRQPEPAKGVREGARGDRHYDSRVSILEKQLEYMRRLVHNAEQERARATSRAQSLEHDKENQANRSTQDELERQSRKISDLEAECYKLNTAHSVAEGRIKDLESQLVTERDSHIKLMQQTQELARVTEENKTLMMSMTPSLPSSPEQPPEQRHQRRKRPRSVPACFRGKQGAALDTKPHFVCGKSAQPSHSLGANVQQLLSALKHDNGALTARVTTQRGRSKRRSTASSAKEIRQVITGLEDDLGVLTFEYQKLSGGVLDKGCKRQLQQVERRMDKKTADIKKLKSCLKKLESEERPARTVARATPISQPLSSISNKEVQICVRGSNTRELLGKVKSIRDVLTNRDIQWI